MQYELVITPEHSRRSWLSPRDPEEGPGGVAYKGPQIHRASFFPSGFGLWGAKGDEAAGALHAVKRSEGLLAKEYVILSQKLPRLDEDATLPADVSMAPSSQGMQGMGPHCGSTRVPPSRVTELFLTPRRSASTSGRFTAASGVPRRLPSLEPAWQGEPEVAAILRGSSSGSHYLLAACTPKQKHPAPPPPSTANAAPPAMHECSRYPEGTSPACSSDETPAFARGPVHESLLSAMPEAEGQGHAAAEGAGGRTAGEASPRLLGSATSWRKRVLRPACACVPLARSPSSSSSQGSREGAEEEGEGAPGRGSGGDGRRARKKTRVAGKGEFQMLHREEGPGSRRGGPGGEERRVGGLTYWGAARRHALMLSACWRGSGYELATTDSREEEGEEEAQTMEAQSPEPHSHSPSLSHSDRHSYSASHSSNTDPLGLSTGHSGSLTGPGMTSSFSSTTAGSLSSSGCVSRGAASGPLNGGEAGEQLTKAEGVDQDAWGPQGPLKRRLSPPKERMLSSAPAPQPSTFVGVPELAIRFFRPSATGSRGRKAARAMGPGEGYMSLPLEGHDSSREWVMEGIPAAAFQNAAGTASARSWAQSAIQASVAQAEGSSGVRDEALPNVWGPPSLSRGRTNGAALGSSPGLRQLSFTGEPGSQMSDCLLEVYGTVPSRPALQMFGASNTHTRCLTFTVIVDSTQMTPMHAFVSCLARADSLVAGGTALKTV